MTLLYNFITPSYNKMNDRNSSNPFKTKTEQELCFDQIIGQKNCFGNRKSNKSDQRSSNPFRLKSNHDQNLFGSNHSSQQAQSQINTLRINNLSPDHRFSNKLNISGMPIKTLSRSQSKMESLAYEQSIKKFKDLLRGMYTKDFKKNLYSSMVISPINNNQNRCYKATRLVFHKEAKTVSHRSFYTAEYSYIVRKVNEQIIVYQLKDPKIQNIKPICVPVSQYNISQNYAFDVKMGRIFYFANQTQQIVVIGIRLKQQICRIKVKNKKQNPILFLYRYKDSLYLLIVGGYIRRNNQIQGSRFIQMLLVSKWEISLNPVVLKMNIGRIKPFIFSVPGEEPGVYIIGGYSHSQIKNNYINLNSMKDINYSTNKIGIKLHPELIEQCFENQQLAKNLFIVNNINVRFYHPLYLFGGCVLYRKVSKHQKLQLFLPKFKTIYELKIMKDQLYIIESQLHLISQQKNIAINYHRDHQNQYYLFKIDDYGKLALVQQKWRQSKNKTDRLDTGKLGKIQLSKKQQKNNKHICMIM